MKVKKYSLKTVKFALKFLLYFIAFIIIYLIMEYVLSRHEIAREMSNEKATISIFIKSNGVHTDIVCPVKNEALDWRTFVLPKNTRTKDSIAEYIAFGWGDKGFYLNTPNWGELKFSTAFNAAFGLSTSAVHTTYYKEMIPNKTNCKEIKITQKQYERLAYFILKSFKIQKNGKLIYIKTDAVYGDTDAFYDANGTYSLFHTCNTWANNALLNAGQKAALWTAFQDGIFYHYE
ncbi:MAG: TIGR02117 family protein [Flavobacteriia bacterium]|jgi:uncharacterized protein (TIGR02117 family)